MMILRISLFEKIIALLLLAGTPLSGQNFFQKNIDSAPGEGYANDIAVLPNGNLIFGGRAQEISSVKGWLVALTADGDLAWAQSYAGGTGIEEITAVITTNNGQLLASITTISPKPESFLIKTDAGGNLLWARHLEGGHSLIISDLLAMPDGYLVSGRAIVDGNSLQELGILMKIDENGDVIWQKLYDAFGGLYFRGIAADDAGNLFVAGQVENAQSMLARFTPSGDPVWMKSGIADNDDEFTSVSVSQDGRVRWYGPALSFDPDFGAMLLETDLNGTPNWSRVLYLPQASLTPGKIASLPGGDVVLTAWSYNSLAQSRAHLVGIAADGSQVQWAQELYTGDAGNTLPALEIAPDGSILTGGGTRPSPFFGAWWFFRTDSTGQVPDCCAFPQTLFTVQDTAPQFSNVDVTLIPAVFNSVAATVNAQTLQIYLETPCPALDTTFTLSDSMLCPGECLTIAVPDPASSLMYEWTFAGGMPEADSSVTPVPVCYLQPGQFEVALTVSSERCSQTTHQDLIVRNSEQLPNAFTPNGDQVNDVFRPQPACEPENYRLEIYNRWGEKVFTGADSTLGWDGDDNGTPAPSDVYVWVVYYETVVNGERKQLRQSGDVALLR